MRSLLPGLAGLVFLVMATSPAKVGALELWRTADVEQAGQLTIYNRVPNGSLFGMPVELADLNGDGLGDAILSPMLALSGPPMSADAFGTRDNAGELTVVLGDGTIAGEIDVATYDPGDLPDFVTLIYGRDEDDLLGTETGAADLDGDGFADIIAGTQLGDGPNNVRPGCGEVAIIWGGPNFGGRVIDTADPLADVTFVYGADIGDRLGVWVFAGDVDGDGIQDAVLGADQGDGPENMRSHVGETWVIYGGAHLRAIKEIDLADTELPRTVVYGIDDEDHSGSTVRAGDLDADGTDELLIGAGLNRFSATADNGHGTRGGDGPNNDRTNAGEAYALYLGRGARPGEIDLRDPPESAVIIYGVDAFDAYGEELFVGDFNGDGFGEIAMGAIVADGPDNSRISAGELALVMGGPDLPGSVIDLRESPAGVVFFQGGAPSAIAGDTAQFADIDNDGLDDLIIASPNAPVDGVDRVGVTHIFFGTEEDLPSPIDLADVPDELSVLLIEGREFNDMLAYSMGAGDADGDGVADLMLNVMDGDGFDNQVTSSGDANILSGVELSRAAGRTAIVPTATPTPVRCVGDCNGDGRVTVDELILAVRIQLGLDFLDDCLAIDGNRNGQVAVSELIQAVNNALNGCP